MIRMIFDALDMLIVLSVAGILLSSYYFRGHEKNKLYGRKWALAGGWFMVFYFCFLVADNFVMR
jgi:hypothetical protein